MSHARSLARFPRAPPNRAHTFPVHNNFSNYEGAPGLKSGDESWQTTNSPGFWLQDELPLPGVTEAEAEAPVLFHSGSNVSCYGDEDVVPSSVELLGMDPVDNLQMTISGDAFNKPQPIVPAEAKLHQIAAGNPAPFMKTLKIVSSE
jgi:hypothetical protein